MTIPANWYPDPNDPAHQRYWDGRQWTEQFQPLLNPPPPLLPPPSPNAAQGMNDDDRQARLSQAVANEVANGSRVESHSSYQAVLVNGRPVNHLLHLIIALVTCGFWALVWLLLVAIGGEKRVIIQVDTQGNILRQLA